MKRVTVVAIKDGLTLKEVYANDGKSDVVLYGKELHENREDYNSIDDMIITINKMLKFNHYYCYYYDEFGGKCYNIMMIDVSDYQSKRYIVK